MSISGGIIRGKAVAGYNPTMQSYDGSTGYYAAAYTSSGNKVTVVARFSIDTFAGTATQKTLANSVGTSNGTRFNISVRSSDWATADQQGKMFAFVSDSSTTTKCLIFSNDSVLDGEEHTMFFEYDGDAGTAEWIIDGTANDDTGVAARVAPAAGTLDAGASTNIKVGLNSGATSGREWPGDIGYFGYADAGGLDWSDFMDAYGNPKELDESTWTEWGAQPLFWHDEGIMTLNKGSAGAMTANGTITTAAATTAFMGIKNGIVGPVARGITRRQESASAFDAAVEALDPDLWYKFQDSSFATSIADYSGNGEHLFKQYSVAATAADPIRTTQTQSARFAANTSGQTYTDNSPVYAHSSTAWATANLAGSTAHCYQVAFKISGTAITGYNWSILGSAPSFHPTNYPLLAMSMNELSDELNFREWHTTGTLQENPFTNAQIFDGETHIITARYGGGTKKFFLDGSEISSAAYGHILESTVYAWSMGGSTNSTGPALQIDHDHQAVWVGTIPSVSEITDMHNKYLAEIA